MWIISEYLSDLTTLLVFASVLFAILAYKTSTLPQGFPPGPTPLPIIGNVIQFARYKRKLHKLFCQYRDIYGDIIGFKLAWHPAIVLNSLESIKEAFITKSHVFSARPDASKFFIIKENIVRNGLPRGIIWQNGPNWRDLRRFTLTALRDFGFGKRTVEQRIKQEASIVGDVLSKTGNKGIDVTQFIQEAVSNIICSLVFGSRYDYDDPEFKRMMYVIGFNIRNTSFAGILNFFPILRYLPSFKWYWENRRVHLELREFVHEQIKKHRQTFDPKDIRDYVDHYLVKENEIYSDEETFSQQNMLRAIIDLFLAGTETTSTVIRWVILFLITYPEAQKKCQQELDLIVGSSRQVSISDKDDLPFIESVIHEVQRLRPIAPLGVPHCANHSTKIQNYQIPKGTLIFPNIYAVHFDSAYFDEPEVFRPERWINKNGKFQKNPAFLVFSIGPRVCLGETLARTELFLFLSNLLQRFSFKVLDPLHPPSHEASASIGPLPYKVIIEPR